MALYWAYGELTVGGVTRTPFLLDVTGTTPVAISETAAAPDLQVHIEPVQLNEPGGTGKGPGIRVYAAPVSGVINNLRLRVVIRQDGSLYEGDYSAENPAPVGRSMDLIVIEYSTTGSEAMPPLIMTQLGTVDSVSTIVDAQSPVDRRLDDEIAIEACTLNHVVPLSLRGGQVSGPLISLGGKKIAAGGAYGEVPATILGIDLARVLSSPPPTAATSPTSATWFDITARPPASVVGPQTHFKVTIRTPHVGPRPLTAPQAALNLAPGSVPAGSQRYRVAFAHANGNETPLGPYSTPVSLPIPGSVALTQIEAGPHPPDKPEHGVVQRRIYRQGPTRGDDLLVGQLPGPAAPAAPHPLPTTFVDSGAGIDIGGGETLAAGEFRYPSRLAVRYTGQTTLNLDGSLLLASAGTGASGVDVYSGAVRGAPGTALVVQDDRAGIRADLHPARITHARLSWSADAVTDQLSLKATGIDTPFGRGVAVDATAVPLGLGVDWWISGDLLTTMELRGETTLQALPDPAPAPGAGAPDPIGAVAVRLGAPPPTVVWPAGEATVGGEVHDTDAMSWGRLAVRGLRQASLIIGDGFPGPGHQNRIRAGALLGADSANPPGGERSARVLYHRQHAGGDGSGPGPPDLRVWARAGVLPDAFSFDLQSFPTGEPQLGTAIQGSLIGALQRLVTQVRTGGAVLNPDAGGAAGALVLWASLLRTGDPQAIPPPTISFSHDDQDTSLVLPEPWQVEGAVGLAITGHPARLHAQLRVPMSPSLHLGEGTTTFSPSPDGTWGRAALAFVGEGQPVATRANPQVRLRRHPAGPPDLQIQALTARLYGVGPAQLDVLKAISNPSGYLVNPVATTTASLAFTGPRPNRSLRAEVVELDPRLQPQSRVMGKARIGVLPDGVRVEAHTSAEPGGGLFFVAASTSEPIIDGVVWAEPFYARPPGDPRGEPAGVGNVAAMVATLPTSLELVSFAGVPAAKWDEPRYGNGVNLPTVHTPQRPARVGGGLIRFGGPLVASNIRIAGWGGDAAVCLDSDAHLEGKRSQWSELLVPLLSVNFDPSYTGSSGLDDAHTVWYWSYTSPPPPPPPPPGPPPGPCDPQPPGPDLTNGTAFAIGAGLLVDLALRQYGLEDHSSRTFSRWDGFAPATDVDGAQVGTWRFSQDLQMKGYRNAITIVDSPSIWESMDNPFGDWEGGPGQWYLRARDKLKLVIYKGDLYMGNTGNGYHIPGTNGIFSTLAAIYNIVWP